MLTIAETVVRNRERRRRALLARREGKAVAQVVAEESHDRLARMVAENLAPILATDRADVRADVPVAAPAYDSPPPVGDDPRWQLLQGEVSRISAQIDTIGRELAWFRDVLSRTPQAVAPAVPAPPSPPTPVAKAPAPAPPPAAPRAEEPPRHAPIPREAPGTGKVPIGDIAAMIDHIQQQYYR